MATLLVRNKAPYVKMDMIQVADITRVIGLGSYK